MGLLKSTIHEIFKQTWTTDRLSSLVSATESPPKINDVALHLSAEYLRRFTIELIHRSNQLAEQIQIDQQKQKLKSSNTFQLDDDDDCLIEVRLFFSSFFFSILKTFLIPDQRKKRKKRAHDFLVWVAPPRLPSFDWFR